MVLLGDLPAHFEMQTTPLSLIMQMLQTSMHDSPNNFPHDMVIDWSLHMFSPPIGNSGIVLF